MAQGENERLLLQRAVAFIVDGFILGLISGSISMVLLGAFMAGVRAGAAATALLIPVLAVINLGYFIWLEARDGQTLGKKLMNIRVVMEDGSEIGWFESGVRNVLRVVDGMFGYLLGVVVILVTEKNQRIGDLAASTVVQKA